MSIEKMSEKVTESNISIKEQNLDKRIEKNDFSDMSQNDETLNIDSRLQSYKDDNGVEYRIGDNLIPNNHYELNGYRYETDSFGRIKSVEGNLHLKQQGERLNIKDSMDKVGRGDQRITDEKGHIIGDQFDGTNGIENSTAQDLRENRGTYEKLENQLAEKVREGKDVKVKIKMIYEGDSFRPSARIFNYSIDGEKHMQIFPNGGTK